LAADAGAPQPEQEGDGGGETEDGTLSRHDDGTTGTEERTEEAEAAAEGEGTAEAGGGGEAEAAVGPEGAAEEGATSAAGDDAAEAGVAIDTSTFADVGVGATWPPAPEAPPTGLSPWADGHAAGSRVPGGRYELFPLLPSTE